MKTPHDRTREALVELLASIDFSNQTREEVADALLAAGWRRADQAALDAARCEGMEIMRERAAQVLDTHGDGAANEALGQRLCCSGQMCGCMGSDVGGFLQHLIRALPIQGGTNDRS